MTWSLVWQNSTKNLLVSLLKLGSEVYVLTRKCTSIILTCIMKSQVFGNQNPVLPLISTQCLLWLIDFNCLKMQMHIVIQKWIIKGRLIIILGRRSHLPVWSCQVMPKLLVNKICDSDFLSVVSWSGISVSPGNLLEMQILRIATLHIFGWGPEICVLTSPPGDSAAYSNLRTTAIREFRVANQTFWDGTKKRT